MPTICITSRKSKFCGMVEPYRHPRSFTSLVTIYICAFYKGVIGVAITEQLYKEKYWEEHPGEAVPLMKPMFHCGPWKVMRGNLDVKSKIRVHDFEVISPISDQKLSWKPST